MYETYAIRGILYKYMINVKCIVESCIMGFINKPFKLETFLYKNI